MNLSDLARRMIFTILAIALISVIASAIYYRSAGFIPFLIGVFLGSAISIFKVFLVERAVDQALTMEKKKAGNYVSLQHLLRLFISGIALFLGAVVPQISLWGVAVGILAYQLAVYNVKFSAKN